jgi:hypothetical protein
VTPPTVTAKAVFIQQFNKKHRPVGKPKFAGFEFDFSTTMNVSSLTNRANYTVGKYVTVTKKVGKKRVKVTQLTPVGFSVTKFTNNSVTLLPSGGTTTFAKGGQITLIAAPPSGIESSSGAFLDGNNHGTQGDNGTFTITASEKGITHP